MLTHDNGAVLGKLEEVKPHSRWILGETLEVMLHNGVDRPADVAARMQVPPSTPADPRTAPPPDPQRDKPQRRRQLPGLAAQDLDHPVDDEPAPMPDLLRSQPLTGSQTPGPPLR
jgi:hypothetical protein